MERKGLVTLIKDISKDTQQPQGTVKTILSEFLGTAMRHVSEDERVVLRGFGTFYAKEKKARRYRDPRTGDIRISEAGTAPAFRPSKALLREINPNPEKEPKKVSREECGNGHTRVLPSKRISNTTITSEACEIIISKPNPRQTDNLRIAFTPASEFDCRDTYPIVLSPAEGSFLKLPRFGRCGTRGYKEADFLVALQADFKDIKVGYDFHLAIPGNSNPYEPDFVLYDETLNLYIDVEIDEPYDGVLRQATHTIEGCDAVRDVFFKESGWVVVRFTERQVHLSSGQCIRFLRSIVDAMRGQARFVRPDVEHEPKWTNEQALRWEREHYRENYLGISSFHLQPRTGNIRWQVTEKEGIDRNIRRTPVHNPAQPQMASGKKASRISDAPNRIEVGKITEVPTPMQMSEGDQTLSGKTTSAGVRRGTMETDEKENAPEAQCENISFLDRMNTVLKENYAFVSKANLPNGSTILFGGRVVLTMKDNRKGELSVNGIDIYEGTQDALTSDLSGETIVAYLDLMNSLGIDTFLEYYKKVVKEYRDEMSALEEALEDRQSERQDKDVWKRLSTIRDIRFRLSFMVFNLSILMPTGINDSQYEEAYNRIVSRYH